MSSENSDGDLRNEMAELRRELGHRQKSASHPEFRGIGGKAKALQAFHRGEISRETYEAIDRLDRPIGNYGWYNGRIVPSNHPNATTSQSESYGRF